MYMHTLIQVVDTFTVMQPNLAQLTLERFQSQTERCEGIKISVASSLLSQRKNYDIRTMCVCSVVYLQIEANFSVCGQIIIMFYPPYKNVKGMT